MGMSNNFRMEQAHVMHGVTIFVPSRVTLKSAILLKRVCNYIELTVLDENIDRLQNNIFAALVCSNVEHDI